MKKGIHTIRNGQKVWPTCANCGCRLEVLENGLWVSLRHHWGGGEKDARGCICEQLNREWNIAKRIILSHIGIC